MVEEAAAVEAESAGQLEVDLGPVHSFGPS